jgi:hypothetical protein
LTDKLLLTPHFFLGIPFNHSIVSMIEQKRKEAEENVAKDPTGKAQIALLEDRAEEERQRGELDKAISTLSEAMTLRVACTEKKKASGLNTLVEIEATVKLLHSFARVFAEKGDTERAERARKDAARLLRKNMPCKSATTVRGTERQACEA